MKTILFAIFMLLSQLTLADTGSFPRPFIYTTGNAPGEQFSTVQDACDAGIQYLNDASDPWNPEYTLTGITSTTCTYSGIYTTSGYPDHTFTGSFPFGSSYGTCPSGTSNNGTNCDWTCPTGEAYSTTTNSCQSTITCTPPLILNEAGTSCVTDCSTQNGKLTGSLFSTSDSSTYCYNGCTVNVNNSVCVTSGCSFDGKYTATACTGSDASTPETPESKCLAKGLSYGTINGQVVCAQAGTEGTPPLKTSDTSTKTTTNGDGETSTETVREYDPVTGKVTTTTTTTTPSGTTTETKQEDKKGFCEENPDISICKGGSFNGSCSTSFSCDGDAVQCATALHLHRARCKDSQDLQSEFASQITEGMQIMNGELSADAQKIVNRDASITDTIDLENEISESGDVAFSAECFDDLTVSVLGQNIVIPISSMCQYLEMMGYILLALAYLSALRIVGIF